MRIKIIIITHEFYDKTSLDMTNFRYNMSKHSVSALRKHVSGLLGMLKEYIHYLGTHCILSQEKYSYKISAVGNVCVLKTFFLQIACFCFMNELKYNKNTQ